ncbi:MAG: glycosyltransferase family 2 protein [Candidatus Aenigmarchaeota archaeon]|nr:glycosyltransferase family 2 protein [Candidatus Aenigmarchaeota archaeon]
MIFIVIPAYNEEASVEAVVRKAKKHGKVVVVDDGSSDKTAERARKAGARVIRHKRNMGLGSSLRTGLNEAMRTSKKDSDIIITLDGDGQHNPDEIPKFVDLLDKGYDFVLGKRELFNYPVRKKLGNFILTKITNVMTRTYLIDTESGFRAFRRIALEGMRLKAKRYEIAVEIIKEIGRNHIRTANVPISSPRYVKGVSVIDGIKNLLYLFKVVFDL